MKRTRVYIFFILAAILLAPAIGARAQSRGFQAKGKEFKDVVKFIETQYRVKKTKIPMLGLANFAVKIVRPAGVKGFKLAVFEDQNFASHPETASFDAVMRDAYRKGWQPLVRINSRREGSAKTYIYARNAGKDVQFAMVTFEEREAVVMEVKFNPDAAARFLENPKIMGVSLGKSVRGGNADIASQVNGQVNGQINRQSVRRDARVNRTRIPAHPNSLDALPAVNADQPLETKPRPALSGSATEENNSVPSSPSSHSSRIEAKPDSRAETASAPVDKDAIRIETRLVNLNVKAMDRAGQPVTNLKPEDFAVYEDNVKQEVTHFKPVNAPVNVILLLDLSGSTKNRRKGMVEAAKKFIDALPAQDKISLVAFTRRYRQLSDFTSDKTELKRVVEQIKGIAGGTAFYDSMWKALDSLDQISDARKAVVVLTDGEDESIGGSEETTRSFDELLGRASEEDVTIYPIYFSSSSHHYDKLGALFGGSGISTGSGTQRTARKQLEMLAEQTGGEVISAAREEDLEGAYKRVASEIHTLYSLAYSPDKLKHNGEFRKIAIKVNRDGAIARTRRGYFDK